MDEQTSPFVTPTKPRGEEKVDSPGLQDQLEHLSSIPQKLPESQRQFGVFSVLAGMFRFTLQHSKLTVATLVLTIIYSIVMTYLPLKIGQILDSINLLSNKQQGHDEFHDLKSHIVWVVVMIIGLMVLNFIRMLCTLVLKQKVSMDMRNHIFSRFLKNDLFFFEKYKAAELVNRITNDIDKVKQGASNNFFYLLRHCIMIVSYLLIAAQINLQLTLLLSLFVPVNFFFLKWYRTHAQKLKKQTQDIEDETSTMLNEKFQGISLIKAFSTEQFEQDRFNLILKKGYDVEFKNSLLESLQSSWGQYLPRLGVLVIVLYGGKLVAEGKSSLSAGQLTSFIMYCSSMVTSSSTVSKNYIRLLTSTYRVRKVFRLLQYQPSVDQQSGRDGLLSGEMEIKKVTFKYPQAHEAAIRGISLAIKKGEYIAVVGSSGSGKSTITKLIEKMYSIKQGTLLYGSLQQSKLKASSIRSQIGLVTQETILFAGTIRDNITYGCPRATDRDVKEAAEKAGCMQFISDSKMFPEGMMSRLTEKGSNLSGGQRQRIAIARALIRKPKILVLDEATSALDCKAEQKVQESIEKLAASQERPTIVVIAHRLSTVINADRIVVMRRGRIVEEGSHMELLSSRGAYYELFFKQVSSSDSTIDE